MGRDRVGLFVAVREDHRQGMGVRAIARKHGVHRRTVREALGSPVPAPRKVPERASPARDSVAPLIDAMLAGDLEAPRKQRHTARRVWCRLRDEHDAEVSYSYVAKYVARRRPEVEAEVKGQAESLEGFVPQLKEPGAEAEVDFGPVTVVLDGREAACHLFAYRLSFSGFGVHRVYASCAQEALLEGHVTAFAVTGGVPRSHVRYDNLTPAVSKVLAGRDRKKNARWAAFRSWYGFEAFYCEPGIGGAHEKGGVEGEIGRFRRNFLVPVPRVKSLADLNARLAEDDLGDGLRHIEFRRNTVAAGFAAEAPLLRPPPADGFGTGTALWPKADRFARISVGKCRYSVPARLIGKAVRVRLTANELHVFEGTATVAVHPRLVASGDEHLVLDHYLEILARKPGALPGSVPLAQARAGGSFTAAHDISARPACQDSPWSRRTTWSTRQLDSQRKPASCTARATSSARAPASVSRPMNSSSTRYTVRETWGYRSKTRRISASIHGSLSGPVPDHMPLCPRGQKLQKLVQPRLVSSCATPWQASVAGSKSSSGKMSVVASRVSGLAVRRRVTSSPPPRAAPL
jgi:transposase